MSASDKGLFASRKAQLWRLAILAVVATLAVIVVLTVSGPPLPLHDVRIIERPLSRLLGFQVSIRGPAFVRPSVRPLITLQDLRVRDAQSASGENALVVRDVRVRFNPLPFILGHWSIARLELKDARLCVSPRRGSPCDWQRALEAIDQVTNIDHLVIERLALRCAGGACGKGLERQFALVRASFPAHRDGQLTVYANEAEDPPLAVLSAASWSVLRADRPLQVRGTLHAGSNELTFDGVIRQPRELTGLAFDFDGHSDLGQWHEVALGQLRIQGRLDEDGHGYRLRIKEGQWGPGTVSADVTAKRADAGLTLEGAVAAHHVDLDPWVDAPAQGQAAGGYADVDVRFTTTGDTLGEWREHMRGSVQVAAGPAELPIDQVERWSKGFLKFVFSLPEEGAATHVNCMGGAFDLRGDSATTSDLRLDTSITRMRAVGSLSLRSGEMDFLVKPQLKKGLLKNAPLVAVSGKIERPVSRLATADESAQSKALFDQLPVEPRDPERPCQ
jgi:uncharacterized protein involved in outer membrane biogenesis